MHYFLVGEIAELCILNIAGVGALGAQCHFSYRRYPEDLFMNSNSNEFFLLLVFFVCLVAVSIFYYRIGFIRLYFKNWIQFGDESILSIRSTTLLMFWIQMALLVI